MFLAERFKALVVLVTVAFSPVLLVAPSRAAEPIIIKIATMIPAGSTIEKMVHDLSAELEAKFDHRIKFRWYFGGVKGDEREIVARMESGEIDGAALTITGLGEIAPEIRILELPFLTMEYGEVDYLFAKTEAMWSKVFSKHGYLLGSLSDIGFAHFYSGVPLDGFEQFKKVNMWTRTGDPMMELILKSMGFTYITSLNLDEVLPAMRSQRVNAFVGTHFAILALQWQDYAKYVTDWPVAITTVGLVLTKRASEKIPADIRKTMQDRIHALMPKAMRQVREQTGATFRALKKRGVKVTKVSPEFLKLLIESTEPVRKHYVKEYYSREIFETVTKTLAEYRRSKR